jgi:hypothetical protein
VDALNGGDHISGLLFSGRQDCQLLFLSEKSKLFIQSKKLKQGLILPATASAVKALHYQINSIFQN